jgi:hypothetical protein
VTTTMAADNLKRRNIYLALAFVLAASTFLFYADEGGMPWMMWRDAPWLAGALIVGSLVCWRLWWRTPRD